MTSIGTTTKALGALLLMATLVTGSGQPLPKQDSDYTPAANSQVVSWQLKRVPPPSALYVGVDDQLVVGAATSQTSEVVTVNYRLLRASDGKIVAGQFTVAPANTRAIKVQAQQLAEGFLLSCSVKAAVATTRGQTFIRVFLGAGPFGAGQPSYMLMADYVTTAMAPAHPNGRVLAPSEGPGAIRLVQGTNPAPSGGFSVAVPTNARWRLMAITAQLTTDVNGANRQAQFNLAVGGVHQTAYMIWSTPLTAGSACTYSAANGYVHIENVNGFASTGMGAGIYLTGNDGDLIQSNNINFQAGDEWSQIFIAVEEWLENV